MKILNQITFGWCVLIILGLYLIFFTPALSVIFDVVALGYEAIMYIMGTCIYLGLVFTTIYTFYEKWQKRDWKNVLGAAILAFFTIILPLYAIYLSLCTD